MKLIYKGYQYPLLLDWASRGQERYCFNTEIITSNPTNDWDRVEVTPSHEAVAPLEPKQYDAILAAVNTAVETEKTPARVRALMKLQRYSGLSLVDAVCLSKDELQRHGKVFRVVTSRQKTDYPVKQRHPD